MKIIIKQKKMYDLTTIIFKYVLLLFGLIGNIIGMIIFLRKSTNKKIANKSIYQALLFIDSIYLFSQVIQDTFDFFKLDLKLKSIFLCKLRGYWNFGIASIPIWFLVFITIERYVSIKFYNFKLLKLKKFQLCLIILIIIYNLILYLPFVIFYNIFSEIIIKIEKKNETINYTILCDFEDINILNTMFTIDIINGTLLPFIVIIIFSCLLIYKIITNRIKALKMLSEIIKKKLFKDIRLSVSILAMNLSILLMLPLSIANYYFYDLDIFIYNIFCCISYSYYCVDFYVLFLFNSNFKNEVLIMFKIR
jgi:hypothetical protein